MSSTYIKQNIKRLQDQSFKNQREFAEVIGLHEASLTRILKTGSIEVKTIDKLVKYIPNLNVNWLLYNKGAMKLDSNMNVVFEPEVLYENEQSKKVKDLEKEVKKLEERIEGLKADKMFLQDLLIRYQSSEKQ